MILKEACDATGGDAGTHRLLEADEMLPDVAQLEALRDVRLLLGRHRDTEATKPFKELRGIKNEKLKIGVSGKSGAPS